MDLAAIGGTEGSDILTGTFAGDHIYPRIGNDIVNGGGGCVDVITGGDGFHISDGDTGNDEMHADAGDNVAAGSNSPNMAASPALRRQAWRGN